jgi:hypothetical protein
VTICANPRCDNVLPEYHGPGMPRRTCSNACRQQLVRDRRAAITTKLTKPPLDPITCPGCGVIFTPQSTLAITCSGACRVWVSRHPDGPMREPR